MCSPKGVRATSEDKHILEEVLQQERCIASREEVVPGLKEAYTLRFVYGYAQGSL